MGMPHGALWVGSACLALLAAARFYTPSHRESGFEATSPVPLATPPGITLQVRTPGEKARRSAAAEWVYADSAGMSLYTYDKDSQSGASACMESCAQGWPAAAVPRSARQDRNWSVLERPDGIRQWMYRRAPLYRYAKDKAVGDTLGDGAEGNAWHVAVFRPGAGMALPAGIAVREIADAGGEGLVDSRGMTLYEFEDGAAPPKASCGRGSDCGRPWLPLEAPEIANPIGDFTVMARDDGIAQWAYRRKPLYRFDGDRQPDEAHGAGLDARFRVALTLRFFMPADAAIRRTVELGNILIARGATLYQRDRVAAGEERHEFRIDHGTPALGRAFGTSTCDAACTKTWPPFTASPGALPSGYWDITTRADGRRQWMYKGFALYTYAPDKPGEIGGNAIYALAQIGDDTSRATSAGLAPAGVAGVGLGALFWHAVVP